MTDYKTINERFINFTDEDNELSGSNFVPKNGVYDIVIVDQDGNVLERIDSEDEQAVMIWFNRFQIAQA